MKNPRGIRSGITIFLSLVLALSMLGACSLLPGGNGGSTEDPANGGENGSELTSRQIMVNESKVARYFGRIIDDPTSLMAFANQMPKGADVRLVPSQILSATMAGVALPFSEEEYRYILEQAITKRIGYLEIVANVVPVNIQEFDSILNQIIREYANKGIDFKVTVNYLAAVDANLCGDDFRDELIAAFALYDASTRVVGVVILPATTREGFAAFEEQMKIIDQLCRARGYVPPSQAGNGAPLIGASPADTSMIPPISITIAAIDTGGNVPDGNGSGGNELDGTGTGINGASINNTSINNTGGNRPFDIETLVNRITLALDLGHAARIDYGASIATEPDVYSLLKRMRDNGISLTVVPVFEQGSSGFSTADLSAYRLFASAGIKVALVTSAEDGSYLDIGLSYAKLAYAHALSYKNLKTLAFDALDAAFLTPEERAKQREKLEADFREFEKNMAQAIDDLELLK